MHGKKRLLVPFFTILFLVVLSVQPAFAASDAILKSGMRGSDVSELQKDLKTLGFFSISPTGYYGSITKAAVIKFQKEYSLSSDGIAGPKTLGKIDSLTGSTAAEAGSVRTTAAVASRGTSDSTGQKIIDYAKRLLGVRYVYGGSTPKGFDCSGFTKYVFDRFGIELNRTAYNQAEQGSRVSKSNLEIGDLVFFDTNGGHNRINHVGIYIGGGKFINASSGHSKVTISDLTEGFYSESYMTARRVLD